MYAGELQAQRDWPVSVLVVSYSCVVLHTRQVASPTSENWPAVQFVQTVLAVVLHAEVAVVPAAHTEQDVQVDAFAVVE